MKKCFFNKAEFVKTAVKPSDYPTIRSQSGSELIEIAAAGRSNVGKSSLLNHLFRSKNLVKTSSTPGKTQALNFFTVDDIFAFVDLPGYGYANVPESVKKQWGPMIQTYLEARKPLKLILFLLDIRRIPNDDDKQFLEWAAHQQKSVILVLTKTDKVKASECKKNTKLILDELKTENLHHVHYSVVDNKGRDQLIHMMHEAIEAEMEDHGTD